MPIIVDSWDCTPDNVEKFDRRTRAGREQEVLAAVRQHGRLSLFWIIEHQSRACAADRLVHSGKLIGELQEFPWTKFTIVGG